MQRWFYANEELVCSMQKEDPSEISEAQSEPEFIMESEGTREWRFCVFVKDRKLLANETVAVSGDCDELGNWEFNSCVKMSPVCETDFRVWLVYVNIPANMNVSYRYLIVATDPQCDQRIVRFFESHLKPRMIQAEARKTIAKPCDDIFGVVNECYKVERGWLTTECIVQFKFFKLPRHWISTSLPASTFYVKATPYFRKEPTECIFDENSIGDSKRKSGSKYMPSKTSENENDDKNLEKKNLVRGNRPTLCPKKIKSFTKINFDESDTDSLPKDLDDCSRTDESFVFPTQEMMECLRLSSAFAFNEVFNTAESYSSLKRQPNFGSRCNMEDLVTVHLTIGDFENTVYLIELFKYSKNASTDERPYRVGYRYVMPEDFQTYRHGFMEIPIICASKHRPLGCVKFGFSIIYPHPTLTFDLSVSYLRHWNEKHSTMRVGHRGQGPTYRSSVLSMVYENTLFSMSQAVSNGAEMVEFDVQLTKDLVPVIYHDFKVNVSMRDRKLLQDFDCVSTPLSKYTYHALKNLAIVQQSTKNDKVLIGDAEERLRLFPTLCDVLNNLDENTAVDIEVKWPQQLCNHKHEDNVRPFVDRNIYVDEILQVVVENAKKRRIVFTSFDADICMYLRYKQNRYPVLLILQKGLKSTYLDPRVRTPDISANFAYNVELLGLVPHSETLKSKPNFVAEIRKMNLICFVYGSETFTEFQELKILGAKAVIFDRMDEFALIAQFFDFGGGAHVL